MSNNESKLFLSPVSHRYKKIEEILTLNTTFFEPCQPKIDWEWSWRKLKNVKYCLHFTKSSEWVITPLSSSAIQDVKAQELKNLPKRIDEIKTLIEKLSKEVATKTDLEKTEKLLVKNQESLQAMLRENMVDLKEVLGKDIEREIGKNKAKRFWQLLEKVATISDIIDFALHIKDLLTFLHEQKIIQIALPFVLKMILG